MAAWLTIGMVLSLPILVAGIGLIVYATRPAMAEIRPLPRRASSTCSSRQNGPMSIATY